MSDGKFCDDDFINAVKQSTSIRNLLLNIGLKGAGANYDLAKQRIKKLMLDTSHFTGQGHLKGKTHGWAKKIPLELILIDGVSYGTDKLRKRLIREGIFENKCNRCHGTEWLGVQIPLELEHKNGVVTDNRLENLEILCPNCHALTSTYRGRNIGRVMEFGRHKALKKPCRKRREGSIPSMTTTNVRTCRCGMKIGGRSKSGLCKRCVGIGVGRKVDRPSLDVLKDEISKLGFCGVGRKYGVSDNAIRKWLKRKEEF